MRHRGGNRRQRSADRVVGGGGPVGPFLASKLRMPLGRGHILRNPVRFNPMQPMLGHVPNGRLPPEKEEVVPTETAPVRLEEPE
jgi:hypothetical protein